MLTRSTSIWHCFSTIQGLNKDHIFTHHGDRYKFNNLISLYDQQFNRKYSTGTRKWDRHRLAWLPEASDNPMQGGSQCSMGSYPLLSMCLCAGVSTNFGLKEEVDKKWKQLEDIESNGDYATMYSFTYRWSSSLLSEILLDLLCRSLPKGSQVTQATKMATPRYLSSHLHPHRVNKDLHLRGSPLIVKPEVVDPRLLEKKKLSTTL